MATIPDLTLEAGLPANIDAEKTILGAILLDNAAHAEAAEFLKPDDFSLDSHRRIFLRMSELIDTGRTVDIVTLSNELSRYKEVESVGGVAYLASLTEGLPRRPVIEDYIRIVKDKSLLRRLMGICSAAIAKAADQSQDAIGVLDETESQLLEVSEAGLTQGLQPLDIIVRDSFGSIDNLYKHSREITGLATGFYRLRPHDQRPAKGRAHHHRGAALHGQNRAGHQHRAERRRAARRHRGRLQPGNEQGVAAAPHVGLAGPRRSAQVANRLHRPRRSGETAGRARASWSSRASSSTTRPAHRWLKCAPKRAASSRTPAASTSSWSTTCNSCRPRFPAPSRKGYENRTQEVSAISRGLKAMAKELQCARRRALAALPRQRATRDDKRPMLSDLRESGSIEQDADVVAFIHREAYYNRDEEMTEADSAKSEIIIAKQRNGPTGTVHLNFISRFTCFDNPETTHDDWQ